MSVANKFPSGGGEQAQQEALLYKNTYGNYPVSYFLDFFLQ